MCIVRQTQVPPPPQGFNLTTLWVRDAQMLVSSSRLSWAAHVDAVEASGFGVLTPC